MYNVFPATRKSLDPVGTAQSIDGAKRALGSLLNLFNGTVALPAHWNLRDEIIVAGTNVRRIGGGDRAPPSPSILNFYPRSLLLLENIATVFRERWLTTTHLTGATAHERWRRRARSCALREGMQVSNLR